MFSELERLRSPAGRPCYNHVTGAWLSRQLICSKSVVFRILVGRDVREIERRCITAVCWNSFFGLIVKTVDSYFVSRFGRQNRNSDGRRCQVYGRGRVYERCRVYGRCRVFGHCRVYRRVRFVWRDVLNLLERERFVVARVELGERRERSLTRRECDRWHKETVTSSQPVLPPGELGSSRQSVRLGSSSTESPADVTDDRPPWRTRFEAYICFFYLFIL